MRDVTRRTIVEEDRRVREVVSDVSWRGGLYQARQILPMDTMSTRLRLRPCILKREENQYKLLTVVTGIALQLLMDAPVREKGNVSVCSPRFCLVVIGESWNFKNR